MLHGGAEATSSPTLGCSLTIEVECRTDRRTGRGPRHPVTIHLDGSVETPHDLEAERVAVALGGYSSCLALCELGAPVLQEAIGLWSRTLRPPLRWRRTGKWSVLKVAGCGCPDAFASPAPAAGHARSAEHIAARHGCSVALLQLVAAGLEATVGRVPQDHEARGLVRIREQGGIARLWAAGLHPDELVDLAAIVRGVADPLPISYFLGMAYGGADAAFVEAAIQGRPDGDTAAWLAWLPADLRRAEECRSYLRFGLSRARIVALMTAGIAAGRVASTADRIGASRSLVGRAIADWAAAGCAPRAPDLLLLAERGMSTYRPSAAAIDEIESHAWGLAHPPSRTELAMMLAVGGTRHAVQVGLAHGARTAVELIKLMEKMEGQS